MRKTEENCGAGAVADAPVARRTAWQSNMELLRLVAMLFVLVLHANYWNLGYPGQAKLLGSPLSASVRVALAHLEIVAVNVFVLLSGWFGIRPKWRGLAGLLFQAFFFPVALAGVFLALGHSVPLRGLLKSFYPGAPYWFVPAYLRRSVCPFPGLNAFAERSSRRLFRLFLLSFFAVELFYGLVVDWGYFKGGYSAMSFTGLYLLAR